MADVEPQSKVDPESSVRKSDVKLMPQPTKKTDGQSESTTNNNKREKTCAEAARSPTAFIGWGSLFCLVYCIVTAVATHIHWPSSDLCSFPPLQDDNSSLPMDYPNPRCPDYTRFDNDTGPYWYYWRAADYVWWSQLTAWIFYCGHQLSSWYLIFRAQMQLSSDRMDPEGGSTLPKDVKYSDTMRGFNWWALGLNAGFVVLHLLQTHFMGYDALAPSVHEMASQGSVILMLVIIMMMETDRRGMFFGQPIGLYKESLDVAKRYHGYIFSWAAIFTFWYHPMEGYLGHLFGIFHVLIIMLQGSLMFTNAHLNRLWRMILEAWVFLHATVISTQTLTSNSWPMFIFGFGALFVISQLPGLPCMIRCHVAVRLIPLLVFAILYATAFVLVQQWTSVHVVLFIPAAMYGGAMGLNVLLMIALVAGRACCRTRCSRKAGERPISTCGSTTGFTLLAFFIMVAVIVCAMVSEVILDRHSTVATIVVYGSMCVGIFALLLVLPCALPRPRNEARRDGCTNCCFWNLPECCGCCPRCGRDPDGDDSKTLQRGADVEMTSNSKAGAGVAVAAPVKGSE